MNDYNMIYNIPYKKIDKFIERVEYACNKLLFVLEYEIDDKILNNTISITLKINSTSSTGCHMLSHDNLLSSINYWDDDIMYNIFIY